MENDKQKPPVPINDEVLRRRLSDQKIHWLLRDEEGLEADNQDIVDEQALREKGTVPGDDTRYKFSPAPTEREDPTDIALDNQKKAWQSGNQDKIDEANEQVKQADRGSEQSQ